MKQLTDCKSSCTHTIFSCYDRYKMSLVKINSASLRTKVKAYNL